jgi:hypothetical protein
MRLTEEAPREAATTGLQLKDSERKTEKKGTGNHHFFDI